MKKKQRLAIDDALNSALKPPGKRPSGNLNSLLSQYAPPAADSPAPRPASVPVTTPAITPVTTPVVAPVATPVMTPAIDDAPEGDGASRSPAFLDATHTASESRVYSVMYRQTISKGMRERHFGPKELLEKTGIRSDRTIRTAIDGLLAKLSIEIVSYINGNPLGPRYRIFDPKEILKRRRAAGIEIDPQSKCILTPATTGVVTPAITPVTTGDKTYRGAGVETTGVTPAISTGVSSKYINDDLETLSPASSSSKSTREKTDDDAVFLNSIREVYERATGNAWTTADTITAQAGRDIRAEVWTIAICYCVDRAPGHTFQRLAYVLEQAREHDEEMKGYSNSDLRMIARHTLRMTERARAAGKWTLAEIETAEGKGTDS
jgi:hypothetical protein